MLPKGYISLAIYSAVIIISGMTNAIIYVIPPPGILESVLSKRVKCLFMFSGCISRIVVKRIQNINPLFSNWLHFTKIKNTVNNIS